MNYPTTPPDTLPHQHDRHLACAIATSPYGESGGSLFAWETWVTCQRTGIASIFATSDLSHRYPLMSLKPRRIQISGHERFFGGDDLRDLANEARQTRSILILDLPRDFGDDRHLKQTLKESGIGINSTLAALIPLMPGQPGTWGAALGVGAFEKTGIYFDHGLCRYWDPCADLVPPEFPAMPGFPFWAASTLSSRALSLIHSQGFSSFPLTVTRDSPIAVSSSRSAGPDPWVSKEIERHLEQATRMIREAVLEPLVSALG